MAGNNEIHCVVCTMALHEGDEVVVFESQGEVACAGSCGDSWLLEVANANVRELEEDDFRRYA